jgi:hypothetical protein
VSTPQNEYVYNPHNLWLAYGIGIAVTMSVVLVGFACIWTSGASFGSSFSAILRTTRNPDLDAIVPPHETHGTFPISNSLGRTKLVVRRQVRDLGEEPRTAFAVVDGAVGDGASGLDFAGNKDMWKRRMSVDSLLQERIE